LALLAKLTHTDVLVIGGGINGAGIARDLSGRGLSVFLCEKDDLASATSSASTKLIHGGLRYLEHHEFRLVREALKEREVLLNAARHLIWPLTFVLPHHKDLRPWWMIRAGLYLYDWLGGKISLPRSKGVYLQGGLMGSGLKNTYQRGFTYADCWGEDSRLVVSCAIDAHERGAKIMTRTECVDLQKHPKEDGWAATMQDHVSGETYKVHADMIVNASGPWVARTLGLAGEGMGKYKVRWVKGSHLIVPRLYPGEHAYILQNDDKRIVFVIPYERKFSLIGTTDVEFTGDMDDVRASMDEAEYLLAAVNKYLRTPVRAEQIIWAYSGVRPLVDDGKQSASSVTRDYVLNVEECNGAPVLSVYGGKITTFRRLSEQAADKVVAALGRGGAAWTREAPLPGGENIANFDTFLKTLYREFSWLPERLGLRLARAYGMRVREMLRGMKRISDMGELLGDDVYEFEVYYLVTHEWALTVEDILWRRSKLGLHVSEQTEKNIKRYLKKLIAQNGAV